MEIKVLNLALTLEFLQKLKNAISPDIFARKLAELMEKVVHIRTGQLRQSIYFYGDTAGARAPYAFYEANRGGEHDFVQRAINALNLNATLEEELHGLY